MSTDSLVIIAEKRDMCFAEPYVSFWNRRENPYILDGKAFFNVVGVVDMCKSPTLSSVFTTEAKGFFYFPGATNEAVEKDMEGNLVLEASVTDVINFLEKETLTDSYRRYKFLLSLLRGVDMSAWENLVVLYYEY